MTSLPLILPLNLLRITSCSLKAERSFLPESPFRDSASSINNDLPWTTLDNKSSLELYSCLKGHDISGIFCGHIHLNKFINWNNIPIITSSGLQSTIDPLEKTELRLLEAASVNLCKLNKGGLNITSLQIHPAGREIRRVNKNLLGLMV